MPEFWDANLDDGFLAYTDVVLEQQYLPPAVADFFLVALTWCMVGWAQRLAYIAMSLIELRHAIDQNRVSVHGDVPLHALVPGLDPLSRSRFLSFLRARSPATPAAAVGELRQPVALRRAALCVAPGGATAATAWCERPHASWSATGPAGSRESPQALA